jgi:hypothetical protein
MIWTKEGVQPRRSWVVTCVVLGMHLVTTGCSAMSGLRSVGLERPRLMGLWDRSQPTAPGLGDDYYAQSMHAGDDRSGALASRSERGGDRSEGEDEVDAGARGAETEASANQAEAMRRSTAAGRPDRDETVRVTLGRPEPLPGLADTSRPTADLAARSMMSPGEPDRPTGGVDSGRARPAGDRGTRSRTRTAASTRPPSHPATPDARAILARCESQLRALDTYQVHMSRMERVGGRLQPEEDVILSIRRDPKAVRLEWAQGPNQGREVIYSTRLDERSLFVHIPSAAIPLPTMKIPVDSPMVMKNSRHSITEAGFDTLVANLRKALAQEDSTNPGRGQSVYRGIEQPPGLDRPSHRFTRRSPSGETWTVYLDGRSMLPCMVLAQDAKGELEERYLYHEVRANPVELVAADAFDPDRRWGEPKGLLSRFARAAAGGKPTNPGPEAAR